MATDFWMYAGDTKKLEVAVLDRDDNVIAITSATIAWKAARSYGKAPVLSKSTSSGITITDASNGIFQVTLDASDTDALSGTYYHEAEVTFADATISTVLSGIMTVRPVIITA